MIKRIAVAAGALVLSGCFDLPPRGPPDGGGTNFSDGGCDAPALFVRSCVTGCHDATIKQAGLDLVTLPLEPRLFGKHAAARPDYLLIDPELPDESALIVKLSSMPPFGAQMPLGGSLSSADKACVQSWVDSVVDAGLSDAGFVMPDAGVPDSGTSDAGSSDGGGGLPDAGAFDAGRFWGPLADDAGCAPPVDGGQWCVFQVVPEPLYSVRGLASGDIWAVGSRGAAYHYDGVSWSRSDSGVSVTLFDVFPVAANDVWAVGERGLVLHLDSSGWQPLSWSPSLMDAGLQLNGQPTWDLGGVWVDGTEVWVAGGGSTLAHRVGGSMQVVQTTHPNQPGADFIRLFSRGPNEWWAAGDMTFFEWDGAAPSWTQGRGAILRVFGMAGSTHPTMGRILVAVGADGQMLQYAYTDTGAYPWQPPSWNAETYELRRDLRSVWLNADGGLGWTVGLDGQLVHLNVPQRRYQRSMTPTSDHLLGVWGVTVNDAWAVGGRSTGVLLHSR